MVLQKRSLRSHSAEPSWLRPPIPRLGRPPFPGVCKTPSIPNCEGMLVVLSPYGCTREVCSRVAVRLHARSMLAVEADPRLVDQRGAERVGVTESGSHGIEYLVAIAKAAAVGKAGERSRNELRIVGPAIAGKQLIVLGEVLVYTPVHSIDIV